MIRSDNINKGVLMIKLESVGTALTTKLLTHPINTDGTIDTDEGMANHIYDLDSEWFTSLSYEDLIDFFEFIENTNHLIASAYNDWKTKIWSNWENVNNCYMNLEVI